MTHSDQLKQDLDFVASAVRRHDHDAGIPAVHFMWAAIVLVGFALPDFAPHLSGAFWFVFGIGGGLLSWWLGRRHGRLSGVQDHELQKRYGLHWMVAGLAFLLCGFPMMLGHVAPDVGATNFMLVAGIVYALAGVHLVRPLLWLGLLMLAAYAAILIASPPYAWTITGIVIAAGLLLSGIVASNRDKADADQ